MNPGTRLGPYEIRERLGAGGMGEVFAAEDSRLGRRVAIKVLPTEFAADPERLARFEQEARAAAALNHPNIAVVHDVGHEDDGAGGTTHFMVQELLEGQDLHSLLAAGPLSRDRALAIGAQISDALAAAHAAGIVHRDLKPQNVFVSPAGHAKVLDFGLAKLMEVAGAAGTDTTESPTMLGTMAGAVMGSAGYMAPEQASGSEVDHRVDLFAAGCVLYEMLTGQRAFEGETLIDTLHAITRTEPEAMAAENPAIDADVRWLLEKCLAKDPAQRYQSAADLAIDLRRLASGGAAAPGDAARSEAAAAPAATRPWLPWAAAATALLVGIVGGQAWPGSSERAASVRLSIPADFPANLAGIYHAFSPDGMMLAYRGGVDAGQRLVLRHLERFDEVPVLGSEDAVGPFFSPDGSRLAFFNGGSLWAVDVAGGTPRELGDVTSNNSSALWADDGYIYLVQTAIGLGIQRMPEDGGQLEVVFPHVGGGDSYRPRRLPDGRGMTTEVGYGSGATTRIHLFDGSEPFEVRRAQATYLPGGIALFVDAGQLFAAAYEPDTYAITGTPIALESGVISYELSKTGTLAFRYGRQTATGDGGVSIAPRQLTRFARDGTILETTAYSDTLFARPALSPDETMVGSHDDGGGLLVWDMVRGGVRPITTRAVSGPSAGFYFQWATDNVVYFTGREGEISYIDRITIDGTAPRERLLSVAAAVWPTDVADDGSALLYYTVADATERDIWILPLDGSGEPEPFLVTPASERSAVFSPDGRWVAYMSDAGGQPRVYVRPRDPAAGGEVLVTVDGGREPRWSRDGSEIFFRLDDALWAVPVTAGERFVVGRPERLFSGSFYFEEGGLNQQYDVFSNGDFIATTRIVQDQQIRVATNWLRDVVEPLR